MAIVRPFMAVRPMSSMEDKIAALPYDVYNRKEAKEAVKDNPYSFLNIDRAETQFDDSVDTYDEKVYLKAKALYEEFKEKGYYVKDSKPCFYLYEETMDGRAQTGLVCTASVREYETGIIKKHENTRADKELDRIKHVDTLNAQTGPIFLAYRDKEELSLFFKSFKKNTPFCDFTSEDNIRNRAWIIDKEADIDFIVKNFKDIPNLYIADGHHRCASACRVSANRRGNGDGYSKEYDYFLSVIFPDSELYIMDYNRVVKDLNGLSIDEFLYKVSLDFNLKEIPVSDAKPSKKGDVYMFIGDKEYVISFKGNIDFNNPVESLDVSVLQKYLLDPVLNIKDPKTDPRIDFVGGIRGVKELRRRLLTDGKVSFAMYPTQMSELFSVADAGLLMPPKSTWFEPKLRSGLFIHELN